jgi:dethiobiotin synthetase
MTRFFVTGTDTEIGKTWIAAALLHLFAARGARTLGLKPIASGCPRGENGELLAEDAELLRSESSAPFPETLFCPYRFAPAIAPGLAAEQAGVAIDFDRLLWQIKTANVDVLLVEGAGGLLCPLGHSRTFADFAAQLGYPLLVVARACLGTVNHTLLTLEVARQRGLSVSAVLLNDFAGTPLNAARDNAEQIARYGKVRVFGPVPASTYAELPKAVAACVDLDLLADAKAAK